MLESNKRRLILGLVLMAISALWFLSPLPDVLLTSLGIRRFSSANPDDTAAIYDTVNLLLAVINTLFAGIGVYLTIRSVQPKERLPAARHGLRLAGQGAGVVDIGEGVVSHG